MIYLTLQTLLVLAQLIRIFSILGTQEWENGNLNSLTIDGVGLDSIPQSIGTLFH